MLWDSKTVKHVAPLIDTSYTIHHAFILLECDIQLNDNVISLVPSWLSTGVGGLDEGAWFTGGTDEAADEDSSDTPANTKAHYYNTPFPTPLKR